MPAADTPPPALPVLLALEGLLLCGGLALLLARLRRLAPRLLGQDPAPLPPANFRLTELALAAIFGLGGAALFHELARAGSNLWLPKTPDGKIGLAEVVAGAGFQFGLLAGLAHAWFWHLRPSRRAADTLPTPPHPRVPVARLLRGGLFTFLAALVVVGPVGYAWQAALDRLGIEAPPQSLLSVFTETKDKAALLVLMFLAIVVAPITEEIAFRVGIFRWLRGRLPRAAALLVPALLFAAVHGNLAVLLPLVILAVILALGYEHYGHPAVPMIAHALFNLNTIALLLAGFPV